MVGGVFDRPCNGPGAGCVELPGGGWIEGQHASQPGISYIRNGAHWGSPEPGCCSCCRPHGSVCPHGYTAIYELDPNGRYTTELPTLLRCELNPVEAVGGRYWISQSTKGNATRCYCGCCPCTPEEVAFSVVKAEIIVDEKARPVSNVNKELDAWSFELKGVVELCYETQKMGQEGYVDRCGISTPTSWECVAGICNGGYHVGADVAAGFGDDPEYNKQDRRHMYIEAYGFDGKICKQNEDAMIPDRPAFPFFDADNEGMSIVAALCCCKTGNEVEVPELPYNWDKQPEDDVPTPSIHLCPAEKGTYYGQDPNNPEAQGILAVCPGDNLAAADGALFDHNGPFGGLAFPIDSHTQTDYETDYNSFCALDCYRFTLFPKRDNKIPVLHGMQPVDPDGADPTKPEFWKQIWGINGVDGTATCTPCSKRLMKFYHPEDDNEKVTTAERQNPGCNVFQSFYAREFNGDPTDWKTYEFNKDDVYANSSDNTIARPHINDLAINAMGSHRMLYGTCQTGSSKFSITVTGSFDIGCDCQTGFLSCYKSHPGFPEEAIGNHKLSPDCWRWAAPNTPPHSKHPGWVGPCNPHDHMVQWDWSHGATVGTNGCPGNGGAAGTVQPWFMDSTKNYWSKNITDIHQRACEYKIPCGSYKAGGAQEDSDGAQNGLIGVDDTGWDWGDGCTKGPVRNAQMALGEGVGYDCIKVWRSVGNPFQWFSREVMVWDANAGGQYEADNGVKYANICAPWPVTKLTPPPPGPLAWTCDNGDCEEGWYSSAAGSYNTVNAGNIIGCGGDWCPPRCSDAACGERPDCAPAQDDCCGPCINCYGEAENRVAVLPGNICGHGFMKNGEGDCWPSSDYMSYVQLNYVAEIS